MAGQKRNRIIPARSANGAERANKHRFKGFQERVATLKINPIQKARLEDDASSESHIKAKLNYWNEINLSEPFSSFSREVGPLCDNLAQVVHFEQNIVDLLVLHLQKQDVLYLESLLDLTSQLAHDLGHRFEKHYERVISVLVKIVSSHQEVEVLEWSFNTLAWMFQYLSKLLVPDLRPTYKLLAPLLGKEVNKGHIARFAAEAISFLIRKAALRLERDANPLKIVVVCIIQDWVSYKDVVEDSEIFTYGLMNLFADCIKDLRSSNAIRPYGEGVFEVLLRECFSCGDLSIACGVLTNIIHHTNAETFLGIFKVVANEANKCDKNSSLDKIQQVFQLLDTVVEVRKGDRILHWEPLFTSFFKLTAVLVEKETKSSGSNFYATRLAASILHNAPFESLVSHVNKITELLSKQSNAFNVPLLFLFFQDENSQRFNELLRPFFNEYITSQRGEDELQILLVTQRVLCESVGNKNTHLSRPNTAKFVVDHVSNVVKHLDEQSMEGYRVSAWLDLARFFPESFYDKGIDTHLVNHLRTYLCDGALRDKEKAKLLFGGGLKWQLDLARGKGKHLDLTWDELLAVQQDLGRMPLYIGNLSRALDADPEAASHLSALIPILISNLGTGSSRLRSASISLLSKIHYQQNSAEAEVLKIALSIESTSLDHASVRSLSMNIRRISDLFVSAKDHPWLSEAIVYYCFGLLTFNLTPIWTDAIEVMKNVYTVEDDKNAQLLEDIIFRWLETRDQQDLSKQRQFGGTSPSASLNEFQCSSFERQTRKFHKNENELQNAEDLLRQRFEDEHTVLESVPANSSSQAVLIMKAIPRLAEKRSRRLVPGFLTWASSQADSDVPSHGEDDIDTPASQGPLSISWADKKGVLDVFGLVANPKSLYRSDDVYNALLHQLTSGDSGIQKAAFKGISNWKKPGLRSYREHFDNLLDNARFREELTMFLPAQVEEKGLGKQERSEMIQVLLPMLFGRVTARGKSSAGKMTQSARRKVVLESLGAFPEDEIAAFLDIALGPLKYLEMDGSHLVLGNHVSSPIPSRRQAGFVRLAKDIIEFIGDKLAFCTGPLLKAILYCLSRSQSVQVEQDGQEAEEDASSDVSLQKATRHACIQCLIIMSKLFPSKELDPYLPAIFSNAIIPRLGRRFLPENAQSVSGLLQLFAGWASKESMTNYLTYCPDLLPQVIDCIRTGANGAADIVKPSVKRYIIDEILKPLLLANQEQRIDLSKPVLDQLFLSTISLLENSVSSDLAAPAISLLLQVAPELLELKASQLAGVLCKSLGKPNREVQLDTKADILAVLERCVPFITPTDNVIKEAFQMLSKQFISFKDPYRVQLSRTFARVCENMGSELREVGSICKEMNAFLTEKLEEPDLETRARAFDRVLSDRFLADETQWSPIVYNSLHFVRDEETFIRKSASQVIRRFIDDNKDLHDGGGQIYPFSKTLRGVVLPALRRGAGEQIELVRVEYTSIMEHLVKTCPGWSEIADLVHLTVSDEDDESFFGGISHIQQDWRRRSLVKLARIARQGRLGSENIAHFLLPLIEHFVFDRGEGSDAHPLAAQAMTSIGALCTGLEWTQARKTLRRYMTVLKEKPEIEKAIIRLVGVVTEAIHIAHSSEDSSSELSKTMPEQKLLEEDVTNMLLPPITAFLHHKDENVVSLRVPMAVSAVRLICVLDEVELDYRLAPVLTDVCNILRSKAQESRDLSRKTLADIAALIGPGRFSFILKELRVALSRGYQLHVKSYTLHSLLVASEFKPGDLDYCLTDIMRILLDDIFGVTGQEKDADGYTNKAKEVKGSKSMDSAERIARIVTTSHFKEMVNPLHVLLSERLDLRASGRVDELLRRISSGLQQNDSVGTQETLVFCYQLLNQTRSAAKLAAGNERILSHEEKQKGEKFELLSKKPKGASFHTKGSSQHYKLARFALDLLRIILHRHHSLLTPANLSGFLTPIGDILLDAQEDVQISALRLISSILKVPMKQWSANAPIYAQIAFEIVQNQPDTNTEASQAAIKLFAAILRDIQDCPVKDSQIATLVKTVVPDLTQPARQGVIFNFLKAVVARKIVNNEVYQAMDNVARLFVTSGDGNTRNQARSLWLQFVLSYEQSEKRFDQQLSFLAQNLIFEHMEGRQSVMEAIHFLLGKLDLGHQQKAGLIFFLPLVDRAISDENPNCRDMAAILLKELFNQADDGGLKVFRKISQRLYIQNENQRNRLIALQVYGILVESDAARIASDLPMLIGWLDEILPEAAERRAGDWELVYAAMQLNLKVSTSFEKEMFKPRHQKLWNAAWQLTTFPHGWVKSAAAKLIALYLSQFDTDQVTAVANQTIHSHTGMQLDDVQISALVHGYINSLWRNPPEWLASAIVDSLAVVEKVAGQWQIPAKPRTSSGRHAESEQNGSDDNEGAQEDESGDEEESGISLRTVTHVYFYRLSAILRRDASLTAKNAATKLLGDLVTRIPPEDLRPFLSILLRPLAHLTDSTVTQMVEPNDVAREQRQKLTDTSHEIMSTLQKKFTDGEFVKMMHEVQQDIRQKREERRRKRRIEAVADPAKFSKEKMRKRESGRERRKERNEIHRSKRRGW